MKEPWERQLKTSLTVKFCSETEWRNGYRAKRPRPHFYRNPVLAQYKGAGAVETDFLDCPETMRIMDPVTGEEFNHPNGFRVPTRTVNKQSIPFLTSETVRKGI
jgi:hypothetical protein